MKLSGLFGGGDGPPLLGVAVGAGRVVVRGPTPEEGAGIEVGTDLPVGSEPPAPSELDAGAEGEADRAPTARHPDPLLEALDRALEGLPEGSPLVVALLPDLVTTRTVDAPPMRDRELRAHLSRRPGRYVPRPWPRTVVGLGPKRTAGRSEGTRTVAFADAEVVDRIYGCAADAGHHVVAVIPAGPAWLQAPSTARDSDGVGDRGAAASRNGEAESVRVVRAPTSGRTALHMVREDDLGDLVHRVFPDSPVGRDALARTLDDLSASEVDGEVEEDPWGLAATGARRLGSTLHSEASALPLVSDRIRGRWRARDRRRTVTLAAGALVFLLLAAVSYPLGLRRDLDALRTERRRIQPSVETILELQTRTDDLGGTIRALEREEAGAPRWSEAVAGVASGLPRSAYLTSFRGGGDTLTVDGLAAQATEAVEGLATMPGVEGLRAVGPVRREAISGDRTVERFTLAGVVPWAAGVSPLGRSARTAVFSPEAASPESGVAP